MVLSAIVHHEAVERVVILGRGGAGKSTLARRLGAATGLAVTELDALFWPPGLAAMDDASWAACQRELVQREAWILDGDLGPYDREVLSPLAQPRYIVPRLIVTPPGGARAAAGFAVRRALGRPVQARVVYHAVPSALGTNKQLATAFQQAWNDRVSPGELLYTGSPEGAGILQVQRGDDPFAVTTQIRTLWR